MATAKKTDKTKVPLEPKEPEVPETPPEPEEPTYEPPEKYKDKSLEEVIKMNEEAQRQIGKQGDELGRERKEREKAQQDLQYAQTWYQNQQKPQEPQSESPTPFDYDNPVDSVDRIVEKRLSTWTEEQKKQQQQQRYYEATQNYAKGRGSSFKSNPKLYEGIERQTETAVWNAYVGGMIPQWDLADAKTWENAARLIHMHNESWDRVTPPKVKPVSPTPTETPAGVKPGLSPEDKPVVFRDDSKEIIRGLGRGQFSEKEVAEMVKKTRKERAEQEE